MCCRLPARSRNPVHYINIDRIHGLKLITVCTESTPRALDQNPSPPPIGSDKHRSQFGTDQAPRPAGVVCCSSGCEGQACVNARTLLRKLATELVLLDSRVRSLSQADHHSSSGVRLPLCLSSQTIFGRSTSTLIKACDANPTLQLQEPEDEDVGKILKWALDRVSWTNINLGYHIDHTDFRSLDQQPSQPDTSPTMKRGQQHMEHYEEQARIHGSSYHGIPSFSHSSILAETGRATYGNEVPPAANSPHHTASSTGSIFMPPQSPMQAPQPSRPGMLPSPSSMSFVNVATLPPISPSVTASSQASAQTAHLQELQHQISVKTLAFQTLQREYDSLLQKLERQRTKCATLEKKFEVSDVEINSLTDEKEKLQAQVAAAEYQVEELQESRDETRRQLVANGAQYMRIMEMANRLQAQSAEDKKRWEGERAELQQRIKVLEEAMVIGSDSQNPERSTSPPNAVIVGLGPVNSSTTETINVLRAEISRLRIRTQTLESALQTMREESLSIQAAAKKLMESGGKIEQATKGALG